MTKGKRHPVLVLMRGLPGSGKSYIADKLVRLFPADDIVVVDPDRTNYESAEYKEMCERLKEEGVDEKFYPYRFVRAQAHAGIEAQKIVVWTQAFTNLDGFQKTIINLASHAKQHGLALPVLVVEVDIDPETAKSRVAERVERGGLDVPEERFDKFINEYRSFEDEGYDTLRLDGAAHADEKAQLLKTRIESLLA